MEDKRVGLYGGTFSPPHRGHVNAAAEFVRAMCLDKLYIMPANIPPHKEIVNPVPAQMRLAMCRMAFASVMNTEVSDYEISKAGVSYTVDTLRYLCKRFSQVFMLCGDDMFLTLDRWRSPDEIFRMAHIVCMRRYDTDSAPLTEKKAEYESCFGARVTFIDAEPIPVSSTEIRDMLGKGDARASEYVAPSVLEYIEKNGLYADQFRSF